MILTAPTAVGAVKSSRLFLHLFHEGTAEMRALSLRPAHFTALTATTSVSFHAVKRESLTPASGSRPLPAPNHYVYDYDPLRLSLRLRLVVLQCSKLRVHPACMVLMPGARF